MLKLITRVIGQNKKNKLVKLITVLSVFYIFTPYISHATPLQCSGSSTINPAANDIIFYGTNAPGKRYLGAIITYSVLCSFIENKNTEDKIIFKLVATQWWEFTRNF